MAKLTPTNLETIEYGQQFWQHIFNSNAQRENDIFNKLQGLWDGTATEGQVPVYNSSTGKWVPGAVPYPVPQAASTLTIGAGADTTVNTATSKFFTLAVTKGTNLVFSNFNTGMVVDIILQQDATGGWEVTSSGSTIVGTINTDPDVLTWLRCFKVGTSVFINVVGSFTI